MSYFAWRPYVSVAEKRRNAQRELTKLKKKGTRVAPVAIEGRTIARSFWGKSWCDNLERYSDYENRLPRGRSYVRNGSVLDLRLSKGKVEALVAGSRVYKIKIAIAPVAAARWQGICRDCAGTVDSLIELLQGRFEKSVMNRVSREGDGLFPTPEEIKLSCSCPDWADMCKHVAAALYGVGARLDEEPQLLFVLRGVNESELLADASGGLPLTQKAPGAAVVLDESEVAALFGLEMAEPVGSGAPNPPRQSKTPKQSKAPIGKKVPALRTRKSLRRHRAMHLTKQAPRGGARKTRGAN
jgi:uncharacterized Zn finger protein